MSQMFGTGDSTDPEYYARVGAEAREHCNQRAKERDMGHIGSDKLQEDLKPEATGQVTAKKDRVIEFLEKIRDFEGSTPEAKDIAKEALDRIETKKAQFRATEEGE